MADPYKKKVVYEWGNEWRDEDGDIQDCDFSYKLSERFIPEDDDEKNDLVLVYNLVDECDIHDRAWAYVEKGKLPEEFCNGRKVPKRFHEELAREIRKRK